MPEKVLKTVVPNYKEKIVKTVCTQVSNSDNSKIISDMGFVTVTVKPQSACCSAYCSVSNQKRMS